MNDDGTGEIRVFIAAVAVLEVESLGELEIQLERGALMVPAEGVPDENVDLGAIEGTVLGIDGPGVTKSIEGVREML